MSNSQSELELLPKIPYDSNGGGGSDYEENPTQYKHFLVSHSLQISHQRKEYVDFMNNKANKCHFIDIKPLKDYSIDNIIKFAKQFTYEQLRYIGIY